MSEESQLAKRLGVIDFDSVYKDKNGRYRLYGPLAQTPSILKQIRAEASEPPDPRFRFTLETAERILKLADEGLVDDRHTLTMAGQAVQEATMTGLESHRWTTIAYNMKTAKWEKFDKGDWTTYTPQYKATPK